MTHYRLLRDNKESGPFSEQDMIAKGFKPYDLIWVEGKSAGWRYPSEIIAFKDFAPVVEEQPYDRFYKKQPPQKLFGVEEKYTQTTRAAGHSRNTEDLQARHFQAPVGVAANHSPAETPTPALVTASAPFTEHGFQTIPGRHIHVTLPSGNTVNLTTLVARKEPPALVEKVIDPLPLVEHRQDYTTARPAGVENAVKQITQSHPTATVPERVYQPKLAAAGMSLGLIAAACIGIATLVGLGIMIGLSINRDKNERAFNEALVNKSSKAALPFATAKQSGISVSPERLPANDHGVVQPAAAPRKELVQNAVVKSSVAADISGTSTEQKKSTEENTAEKNKHLSDQDEPAVPVKAAPVVINIEKSLSLSPNAFKTGAFGGITGLRLTLSNNSAHSLESVEVAIDYIQANDKVFKTERVLFKDVAAGTQATIDAPTSNRGVKTSSRIIKVTARETVPGNNTAKS
ncbi:MAG: hypothetical protein ABIU63_13430 [Chitinophagaceae bacterium]